MRYKRLRGGFLPALLLVGGLLVAAPVAALPVYGTSAQGEPTGSRSVDMVGLTPPGLTGFNQYATAFTVSWVIDFDTTTAGLWHYKYTFTGLDGSGQEKQISHITLDLSDDCFFEGQLADDGCVTNAKLTVDDEMTQLMSGATILSVCGDEADDPCIDFGGGGSTDMITGAVKFDVGGGEGVMYEFDSNRAPVYGHLFVKDGGGSGDCDDPGSTNVVCNNGLLAGADTMDTNDYVARPNGIIPEPGTVLLLGVGLGGLALLGRNRR